MKSIFLRALLFVCLLIGGQVSSTMAYADLMITPTRIVFEERDRFKEVTLVNSGKEPQIYEMSWVYFRMQEQGAAYKPSMESITEFDASKHIVFTPRRITLAPGSSQKIRLALRRPETIPEGDFHVHLKFASVPDVLDDDLISDGKPRAVVSINVGYTIPVVLRSGPDAVQTTIERIDIQRNPTNGRLKVAVPVSRTGSPHAILGHLFVYHTGADGKEERVGEISNAHIFPEVDQRVFDVHLLKEISGGSLRVVMEHYTLDEKKRYAEKVFSLE